MNRRSFLKSSGLGGVIALSGCINPANNSDGQNIPDDASAKERMDQYLSDASNYDGSVSDRTGESEVTILNGSVEGTEQAYVFEPAAIQIDSETTVTWEWRGNVGHSVSHREDEFGSGVIRGGGETFEYTFQDEGLYLYYCRPHLTMGQKGAVVVGDVL